MIRSQLVFVVIFERACFANYKGKLLIRGDKYKTTHRRMKKMYEEAFLEFPTEFREMIFPARESFRAPP